MAQEMKFADEVFHRLVQIVQEAMLTGVDCSDLLRQIRVEADEADPTTLNLTLDYQHQVRAMHEKLLQQAKDVQNAQSGKRFIIPGDVGTN